MLEIFQFIKTRPGPEYRHLNPERRRPERLWMWDAYSIVLAGITAREGLIGSRRSSF